MRRTQSYILLQGLRFHAFHGVMPQERLVGAEFQIDLRLGVDFTPALRSDDLQGTVSYADVYAAVKQEMATPSALLEHVGGRIARSLFRRFSAIQSVQLRLTKLNPPMGADCQGAGIELHCRRQ